MAANRAALLVLCLMVGAVALAGCGSDSDVEQTDEDFVAELQDAAVAFGDGANELSTQT